MREAGTDVLTSGPLERARMRTHAHVHNRLSSFSSRGSYSYCSLVLYCVADASKRLLYTSMWECESPTFYGYGQSTTTAPDFHVTSATVAIPNTGAGVTVGAESARLHGPTSGGSSNGAEGYAGTANSLANFCTNITETDDALKQVRGGGFLAEFERDDEELVAEEGGGSGSTGGDISPLGETKVCSIVKCTQLSNNGVDALANGNEVASVWVR